MSGTAGNGQDGLCYAHSSEYCGFPILWWVWVWVWVWVWAWVWVWTAKLRVRVVITHGPQHTICKQKGTSWIHRWCYIWHMSNFTRPETAHVSLKNPTEFLNSHWFLKLIDWSEYMNCNCIQRTISLALYCDLLCFGSSVFQAYLA